MSGMTKDRVLGYVMARDEWPVLGLAIVHAISAGVDHVVVVDHQSEDGTQDGLRTLRSHYGDQLSVYRLDDDHFYQEATTAMIMELVDARSFDWVYVFDADEFLLLSEEMSIFDLLGRIPPDVDAVRYEVHNWVAPTDLDHHKLSDYSRVIDRAVPNYFLNLSGEGYSRDILNGDINYFDVPFPTKLMVRSGHAKNLAAGAHSLRTREALHELSLEQMTMRVGHVPLLSRDRLVYKSDQGRVLIESGFPPEHGWQSQMLYRIQQEQGLEPFWESHSMPVVEQRRSSQCTPMTTRDFSLTNALCTAVALLSELERDGEAHRAKKKSSHTGTSFRDIDPIAIRCIHEQMRMSDAAMVERDAVVAKLAAMVDELNSVNSERDSAVKERDAVAAECAAVTAHLQNNIVRLRREKGLLHSQLQQLECSESLRVGLAVTWPFRLLKRIVRRVAR